MNAVTVEKIFYHHFKNVSHHGVYAANRLPQYVNHPCTIVVNTDRDTSPGTHWIAIFIDRQGYGMYFDSYGRPPFISEHLAFLRRNTKTWTYSRKILQNYFSTVCGYYCLVYLLFRINRYTHANFLQMFNTSDLNENDNLIVHMFHYYFNKRTVN